MNWFKKNRVEVIGVLLVAILTLGSVNLFLFADEPEEMPLGIYGTAEEETNSDEPSQSTSYDDAEDLPDIPENEDFINSNGYDESNDETDYIDENATNDGEEVYDDEEYNDEVVCDNENDLYECEGIDEPTEIEPPDVEPGENESEDEPTSLPSMVVFKVLAEHGIIVIYTRSSWFGPQSYELYALTMNKEVGTTTELLIFPLDGFAFYYWEAVGDVHIENPYSRMTTFTVYGDATVIAHFNAVPIDDDIAPWPTLPPLPPTSPPLPPPTPMPPQPLPPPSDSGLILRPENSHHLDLEIGQNPFRINAEVLPVGSRHTGIVWSSSNDNVVRIECNGIMEMSSGNLLHILDIHALSPGTTVITATTTNGRYAASITVTVHETSVTGIVLTTGVGYIIEMDVGQNPFRVNAEVMPKTLRTFVLHGATAITT